MASDSTTEVKRVGRFGLIGILNTLIDFGIFNVLSKSNVAGILVRSNLISTTVAMVFSFFANRGFVFKSKGEAVKQALYFFPITAFGLYVLQNLVIIFLTQIWKFPLELGYDIVSAIGLSGVLTEEFVFKNGAKAVATVVSLTWNYLMYKFVVFRK